MYRRHGRAYDAKESTYSNDECVCSGRSGYGVDKRSYVCSTQRDSDTACLREPECCGEIEQDCKFLHVFVVM